MANGFEKLMKTIGLDPAVLAAQFGDQLDSVVNQIKMEFDTLHDRLAATEKRMEGIEQILMNAFSDYVPEHLSNELGVKPPRSDGAPNGADGPARTYALAQAAEMTNVRGDGDDGR